MSKDLMPRRLYMTVANVGHFVEGAKQGLALRMREDPFEE